MNLTKSENVGKLIFVQFENCICQFDQTVVNFYNKEKNPKKLKNTKHFRNHWVKDNFPEKEKEYIETLINSEEFWNQVEPYEEVVKALNEITALGFDVKIVLNKISPNRLKMMNYKILWIERYLKFHSWMDRLLFTNDFSCLNGKYLITAEPFPEKTGVVSPTWEHVIFDQHFNQKIQTDKRLFNWSNWKIDLKLDDAVFVENSKKRTYFNHGSSDSNDIDRYYLFDSFPSQEECTNFANGSKDEDRNLIVIKNGVIQQSFKGRPDECNNALFTTYSLHEQEYPCEVTRKITRLIPTKIISVIRKMVGLCTSTKWRNEIKKCLKNDSTVNERIQVLKKIDFTELTDLNVKNLKTIAFQICISIALIQGIEIYTKKQACEYIPSLECFIYKDSEKMFKNLKLLNQYRDVFLKEIEDVQFFQQNELVCVFCKKKEKMNSFENQCNGMILDMNREIVLSYPLDHFLEKNATWIDKDREYYFPTIERNLISIFKIGKEMKFYSVDEKKLENVDLKKFDFSGLNFDEYFYALDLVDGIVVVRSKLTNELESKCLQIIQKKE
jgi:hypothetical protein